MSQRSIVPMRTGVRMAAISTIRQAATEFLAAKRVAVTGVSRNPKGHGANVVYQPLRGGTRYLRSAPTHAASKGTVPTPA